MTIEGNKDEAERCIEIAQLAFSAGNRDKAERFILKAEKLYPTSKAKELLTRIRSSASEPPPQTTGTEEVRRRKVPSHQPTQREYNQDQIDAVRRINTKCKDYYEILGKIFTFLTLQCLGC